MKIKMLVGQSGPEISRSPGDEIDVPAAEGRRLIAAEIAIPVPAPKVTTAIKVRPAKERR